MFCMNCGQQLPDGAKFCLNCGASLQAKPSSESAPSVLNVEQSTKLVPGTCTNCGASLQVDPNLQAAICPACGTPYIVSQAINNFNINSSGSINIGNAVINASITKKEPNLIITYNTADPTISMISQIPSLGYKNVFSSGTTQSYKVEPGTYKILFKIGGITQAVYKKEERTVTVKSSDVPVKINVNMMGTFLGKVHIDIN